MVAFFKKSFIINKSSLGKAGSQILKSVGLKAGFIAYLGFLAYSDSWCQLIKNLTLPGNVLQAKQNVEQKLISRKYKSE